jgi:hypothetical protein
MDLREREEKHERAYYHSAERGLEKRYAGHPLLCSQCESDEALKKTVGMREIFSPSYRHY